MNKILHINLSYHCFIIIYIFNSCSEHELHILIIIKLYFIVLHFINKSAFIILLKTADSFMYFLLLLLLSILFINIGFEDEDYQNYSNA
jgi:hypothetical protein